MLRVRFNTRIIEPVNWPVKHPFWWTGSGEDDEGEYHTVVSYADDLRYIIQNWPAWDITAQERDSYEFTARFPKPEWMDEDQPEEEPRTHTDQKLAATRAAMGVEDMRAAIDALTEMLKPLPARRIPAEAGGLSFNVVLEVDYELAFYRAQDAEADLAAAQQEIIKLQARIAELQRRDWRPVDETPDESEMDGDFWTFDQEAYNRLRGNWRRFATRRARYEKEGANDPEEGKIHHFFDPQDGIFFNVTHYFALPAVPQGHRPAD